MQYRILYILTLITVLNIASARHTYAQPTKRADVTVFAAVSLSDLFTSMSKDFEGTHPQYHLIFNYAGSQQLVRQIAEGATVDIFASANLKQMQTAVTTGRVDSTSIRIFAYNRLVIITTADAAAGIKSLRDLTRPGLKIVLAASVVPAGQYALDFLDKCDRSSLTGPHFKEDVLRNVVSYEENVRMVLAKVTLGECDAGIVYWTDIQSDVSHRISQLPIPDSLNVLTEYPIAIIDDSHQKHIAEEFIRYICSEQGQAVVRRFGFITDKPVR